MCCLPSDLVVVDELVGWRVGDIKYRMRLIRPTRPSDWERVLVYAPRIRHLVSDPGSFDLPAVFPSLCPPDNILPNLQNLVWMHRDNEFYYIHLLLGPKITQISILSASHWALLSLHSTVALKCPNLRDVSIAARVLFTPHAVGEDEVQAISVFGRGFHSIVALATHVMDQRALDHLCRLPNLRDLHCPLPTTLSALPTGDLEPFVSLQTLYLSAEVEATTQFLRWCNRVPLTRFETLFPTFSTPDQAHALCKAVAAGVAHASMTDLNLTYDYNDLDVSEFATYLIRPDSFRILLSFTNLTFFCLSSPAGIGLDNETAAEMARAWPQIEDLDLSSYYSPITRPRLGIECLLSFANHCPRLRNLTITFDGTTVPASQSSGSPRISQAALIRLDVGQSAISTPIAVARFISGIFPRLVDISARRASQDTQDPAQLALHAEATQFYHHWREVGSLLPHLLEIRAEGRAWLQGV
ncbi:hypothetical protein DFH09DRAFT_1400917 [Mycena vulgaris]|nr:hypothetical protein DFH09DRAFT_1400917 [Mycena vulgaris]